MKLSVFIATSVDGFIAREDGSIDWLEKFNQSAPSGEDCGYHQFFDSVDVLVMGRNTYGTVLGFEPWPYADKPVVVLSKSSLEIPEAIKHSVSQFSGTPQELVAQLTAQGMKRAYIDGGLIIQSFLKENLIDDLTVTLIPVLIGSGKRLFGELDTDVCLQLVESKSYEFGCVQLKYVAR